MTNPFDAGYYTSEELKDFGFLFIGKNVKVAKNCSIVGLDNIEIGDNSRIDSFSSIVAASGFVRIGRYVHIGGGSYIGGAGGVTLEDFSGLSGGVNLYSASDDYSGRSLTNPTVPAVYTGVKRAPVSLRRHVIIGSGSIVLPGCDLEEGVAVGALSLVNKNLQAWGIYSGVPCRRIAARKQGLLGKETLLEAENNADL